MRSLVALLLLVLTRDGLVHRFDGHHDTTAKAPQAAAIAVVANRTVVLAGGKLTVDGKPLPGNFADVRALAGGAELWALTAAGVSRVDLKTGALTVALVEPHAHRVAADGADAFCEHDGAIVQIGTSHTWKIAGRPIALAAGDGKLYVATKEGPLWEVDRATGKQANLGLGDWWGTIALTYGEHALYAVTVAGKLWKIDPQRRQKTIVAMDGYQGAVDLAVLR
jgi:outer membrane protein assembly factor BamB